MAEVKAAEVSAILRKQLSGFNSEAQLQEVGTVLQVGDGIARIYGLTDVQSGELIEFESGLKAIVLNLEEDNIGAVLLGASKGIKEGDIVKRTKKIASINGYQVVATSPPFSSSEEIRPYWELDWTKPTILVLGNEGSGMHPLLQACCTHCITLPHSPLVQSLNVASVAVPLLLERRRVKMSSEI